MSALWTELRKHLLIYGLFVKNSLIAQLEYRFSFIGNFSMEAGYLLVKLSYVVVVYRAGVTLNGLTPDEVLLFSGTFVALTGLYAGLFMINNYNLRSLIKDGDLDLLLTKPVSTQFLVTLRRSDLTIFAVDVLAGGVMVALAWARLGLPVSLSTVGGYAVFFALSALVSYCLFLLPLLLTFWLLNATALAGIVDSFWDFNSMPMDIYSRWIQSVGIFVLPIFVITNFPPMAALSRLAPAYMAWAVGLPVLLLWVVHVVWTRGLRAYNSASS
ncbi:MAG: ABC-2 family transporter protein [Anaerolineales bacterium]|nr:ABC-2 family transporter protein [Anaerolineales bacterium]